MELKDSCTPDHSESHGEPSENRPPVLPLHESTAQAAVHTTVTSRPPFSVLAHVTCSECTAVEVVIPMCFRQILHKILRGRHGSRASSSARVAAPKTIGEERTGGRQ